MKYYIIAGEASGDLHASNLMHALQKEDASAQFRVWGGDLMEQAGGTLVKHYRNLAFMGFLEVVKNLRTILNNLSFCKKDILHFSPEVLILVDYPGFNLRIAKWAKSKGIRVFYYISPQIWAWHSSRVHQIKKVVGRMFVILPFEKAFYKKYDFAVDFVGHPLLDVVNQIEKESGFRQNHGLAHTPIIALLPGSRKQEIQRMLSTMLQMPSRFPEYQFVIAGAPSVPLEFYKKLIPRAQQGIKVISNQTYQILLHAHAALVTSGTATLETALFKVPQVVCYSGNFFSYLLARRLINVKYISLVNLILDRLLIKELIQQDFKPASLELELRKILAEENRFEILQGYDVLAEKLGQSGASDQTAKLMVRYLKEA